jgi:hypothetical protein
MRIGPWQRGHRHMASPSAMVGIAGGWQARRSRQIGNRLPRFRFRFAERPLVSQPQTCHETRGSTLSLAEKSARVKRSSACHPVTVRHRAPHSECEGGFAKSDPTCAEYSESQWPRRDVLGRRRLRATLWRSPGTAVQREPSCFCHISGTKACGMLKTR